MSDGEGTRVDQEVRRWLDDPSALDRDVLDRMPHVDDLGDLHPAWAGIRTEWLDVADTRARLLRVAGSGHGPTVVLVHGLGGAATNWLPVIQALAVIGDVVAVDLQGFGETEPAREGAARPSANARFVAEVVEALDTGPVAVVGNSMGGLVSTYLAGTRPELVERLVLLCPALPQHLPSARVSRVQLSGIGPMLLPVIGPRIVRRRLQRMSFEDRYDGLIEEIVVDPTLVTHAQRAVGIANLARATELRWRGRAYREATAGIARTAVGAGRAAIDAAISRIQAPTLYVRGEQDPLVLRGTTVHVRRSRPDWVVERPAHIGHVPMLEDPAWTVDRIHRFVVGEDVAVAS